MVPNNGEIMALARDHALLVAGGGENCIRLLPPLTITLDEADEVLRRIEATFAAARVRFAAAA